MQLITLRNKKCIIIFWEIILYFIYLFFKHSTRDIPSVIYLWEEKYVK